MTMLAFEAFAPDLPAYGTKALRVADNVYPGAIGYRPVKSFVAEIPGALPAPCLGAAAFTSPSGNVSLVAGTATNLYAIIAGAWVSIGSGYTTPVGSRWRFAQFGGIAIATNGVDPMQKIDLTGSTAVALLGTPPTGRILAVVKDFLVVGVVNGDTSRLAWSGINNAESWTFGQNQSDYNIQPSGGDINGLFGGEFGLILQKDRITRMEYVGGATIFDISEVSSNFGCVTVHSVVQHGVLGWFLSANGFMMWDGSALKQIGNEKIDRYFLNTYNATTWPRMSAAVDVLNQVVIWSMGDRFFAYHWNLDKWTTIGVAAQIAFAGVPRAVSMDDVDTVIGTNDNNLDFAGLTSLDDPRYKPGDTKLYIFSPLNAVGSLSGPSMAATLTLPDIDIAAGRDARWRSVRPDTDAVDGLTLSIACKARLGDMPATNNYTALQPNGDMPVRESGRYARMSLGHAAGSVWTFTNGLEPIAGAGMRR